MSFRLVYDTDTGRPKGFGFAEFTDTDAAASAVRNLDKYQVGGRELRVDFSHVGAKDENNSTSTQPNLQPPPSMNGQHGPPPSSTVGPLPPGVPLPPNLTCPDAISQTLNALPTAQLLDILSQFKNLVMQEPARATELLKQAPQLSFAMFQALLMMGLVDPNLIKEIVEGKSGGEAPPAATQMPQRQFQPPVQHPGYAQQNIHTPPVRQPPYQPPPPQPSIQPGHEELLKQVLEMPQADVDKLQPNERAQIMALKQQFGGRIGY